MKCNETVNINILRLEQRTGILETTGSYNFWGGERSILSGGEKIVCSQFLELYLQSYLWVETQSATTCSTNSQHLHWIVTLQRQNPSQTCWRKTQTTSFLFLSGLCRCISSSGCTLGSYSLNLGWNNEPIHAYMFCLLCWYRWAVRTSRDLL